MRAIFSKMFDTPTFSRHSSLSRFKELLAGALVVKIIEYNYGISEKLNGRNQRDPSWLPDVDIGSF